MRTDPLPKETAYYYPEPYWLAREGNWIKSLLLFFDDIAILLPEYMNGHQLSADPTLAAPLQERGLLRALQPEWFVDEDTTQKLTDVITALIESGAFDNLERDTQFAELSMSRMGYVATEQLAHQVFKSLAERGLAERSRDGVSIPMHYLIRAAYLIVLAQLARETGSRHHLDLHPVTNGRGAEQAFTSFFNLEPMPSRGQIISFDLEVVSVDLEEIPLDDVLQFRDDNRDAHRRYMQNLRNFAVSLSGLESADRQRALADRRAELQEEAQALRRLSFEAWKKPVNLGGFGLGLAGAAVTLASAPTGTNPVPAALITALVGVLPMLSRTQKASAYTYLFKAARGPY
jgi:hypothetical protein